MKLVICDFNKTLYDPAAKQLFSGALATLGYFQELGSKLVLLSTEAPDRAQLLEELGIAAQFDKIYFVTQKTVTSIQELIAACGVMPQNVLIIGDDPEGELLAAQQLHIPAIAVGTGYCDKQAAAALGAKFCPSIKEVPEIKL